MLVHYILYGMITGNTFLYFQNNDIFLSLKTNFVIANSADEMSNNAPFHLGLTVC